MRKLGDWFDRVTGTESPEDGPVISPSPAGEADVAARAPEGAGGVQLEQVVTGLRQIYDPEIPVNIYDLGLVYRVEIGEGGAVHIDMTLTAPGCPVAQEFPGMVEAEVCRVPGVTSAHVEIVWDPPWTPDRMSDEAKLELGML